MSDSKQDTMSAHSLSGRETDKKSSPTGRVYLKFVSEATPDGNYSKCIIHDYTSWVFVFIGKMFQFILSHYIHVYLCESNKHVLYSNI